MALKSGSFRIDPPKPQASAAKKARAGTYRTAMDGVVQEARRIAKERRSALEGISDAALRTRAAD